MKKQQYNRIRHVFSSAFNVRSWSDFDRVKGFSLYLKNGISRIFILRKHVVEQSFDEVLKQNGLSEEQLQKKQKALLRLSILMGVLAAIFFFYSIYLIVQGSWHAMFLGVVVMMLATVFAFRYHFWYFQIKERKLGCSFSEWFKRGLMGHKD